MLFRVIAGMTFFTVASVIFCSLCLLILKGRIDSWKSFIESGFPEIFLFLFIVWATFYKLFPLVDVVMSEWKKKLKEKIKMPDSW